MVNNAMNYWVLGLLSFLVTAYSWNPNLNVPGGPFNNNNNNRVNNPQENNENVQSLPVSDISSSEAASTPKAMMTPMMDRKKAIAYCAGILGTATSLGSNPTPAIAAEPIPTRIELTVDTEYLLRCLDFFDGDLNMAIATIARSRKDSEIKVDPPREDLATVLKAIYKNKSPEQLTGEQFWLPATIVPYQENLWAESWNEKQYRVVTKSENGIETAFSFNIAQAALAGLGTVASTYPVSYAYYDYQMKEGAKKAKEKKAKLAANKAAKAKAKAAAAKKKDKKGEKVKGAPSKKKAAKEVAGDKNGPVAAKKGPAAEAKKKKDKVKGKPSNIKLSIGEDGELYAKQPPKTPKRDPSSPSIVGIDTPSSVAKEAKAVEKATQIPPPPPQPEVAVGAATTTTAAGGGSPNKQIDPYAAAYAAAAAPKSPPVETAASTASDATTPAVAPPVQSPPADDYSASFAESLRQMTRQ